MKNSIKQYLSVTNIVFILTVLYICFQVYELPAQVKDLKERVMVLEKEIIVFKTQQQLILNATYETRNDVKQILKDVK